MSAAGRGKRKDGGVRLLGDIRISPQKALLKKEAGLGLGEGVSSRIVGLLETEEKGSSRRRERERIGGEREEGEEVPRIREAVTEIRRSNLAPTKEVLKTRKAEKEKDSLY